MLWGQGCRRGLFTYTPHSTLAAVPTKAREKLHCTEGEKSWGGKEGNPTQRQAALQTHFHADTQLVATPSVSRMTRSPSQKNHHTGRHQPHHSPPAPAKNSNFYFLQESGQKATFLLASLLQNNSVREM